MNRQGLSRRMLGALVTSGRLCRNGRKAKKEDQDGQILVFRGLSLSGDAVGRRERLTPMSRVAFLICGRPVT
jgi:hypothetical protein